MDLVIEGKPLNDDMIVVLLSLHDRKRTPDFITGWRSEPYDRLVNEGILVRHEDVELYDDINQKTYRRWWFTATELGDRIIDQLHVLGEMGVFDAEEMEYRV